jgi:5-methyltetrahydropteroyltriglutamate--homocysteine methyltransferase
MRRSDTRILTTHAGSLPRPPALTRLHIRRLRGEAVDPQEFDRLGREALRAIVEKQEAAGVDIAGNGEQAREGFFLHVRHRLSGFGGAWRRRPRADAERYPLFKRLMEEQLAAREAVSNMMPPKAIGEVRSLGTAAAAAECAAFKEALAATGARFVEPFLTAPSPGIIAGAMKNEFYDSESSYLAALGEALKGEYETIVNSGFLLQLDCPDLALERHLSYQDRPLGDFLGFVERVVETINRALENIPRERVRLHVCWGNYEGPHTHDIPLAKIFACCMRARPQGLLFEAANPRHAHEWEDLRDQKIPDDKVLMPGVIDSTTNFVEHPRLVAQRIRNYANLVGRERVIAGTDCGFATFAFVDNPVAPSVVWAKLAALAEGARIASDRLWG